MIPIFLPFGYIKTRMGALKLAQQILAIAGIITVSLIGKDLGVNALGFVDFALSFALATSIISMIIFAYELHEKWCFTKLPWSMLEFLFPIFMVLLLCAASIVGLITASLRFGDDGLEYYNRACIAASVLGLLDCIPWGLQAFFQYSINNS